MRSVVVVEDFELVRDALVRLLKDVPEVGVVGTAASVRDARVQLEKLRPDVLLTELLLDDGSAVELLRVVRRERMNTRVIVVTRLRDSFAATEAISAGADGYVLKSQPSSELFEAIETVLAGRRFVSPAVGNRNLVPSATPTERVGLALLSSREIEILRLIASGSTSAEIAQNLSISTKTIDTHRSNMYRKLTLRNQVDLVRFATMHGIGPMPTAAPGGLAAAPWPAPLQMMDGRRR